ncbi:MAG TPA: winged helix-turn-helix domain-containing protein, partial [Thermoanaerobaculia bacterium]
MEDRNRTPRGFAFGPFTLDPAGAELRRGGEPIALRPKCFDLLVYFVQHPGRVISKDELMREIWGDVIVDEGTINRTVTALRASLGDESDDPRYIQTVPRRGYKFIAAVATEEERPQPGDATAFALIHNGKEIPLREGEHLIGRGNGVSIPLFGETVSRRHARIIVTADSVSIEDTSRHGTFVNGQRIAGSAKLHSGDELRIGGECLV